MLKNRGFTFTKGIYLFCLLALFLFVAHQAQADVVVTFGDSITEGSWDSGDDDYGGYAPHLQALMLANGQTATVKNKGRGGETTAQGVNRLPGAIVGASIVLILEGSNDVIQGISASTTAFNLGTMVDHSKAANVIPILGTLPPNTRNGDHPSIPNSYNPAIVNVAAGRSISYADLYLSLATNWQSLTRDGLHPNAAGNGVIAATFYASMPASVGGGGSVGGAADGDDDSGGCFIATAAYGSLLEPHVVILQDFRDRFLLTNLPGKSFVRLYYQFSPPMANYIARHDFLRSVVRLFLVPLVGFSVVCLNSTLSWLFVLLSGFIMLVGTIIFLSRRFSGKLPRMA